VQFNPYLQFDGHCTEAFAFYAQLFGGTIVHQSHFGDMPAQSGMPALSEAARNRIMHLQVGSQALMGSDAMPGADASCGDGYQQPQGLWVSIQAAGVTESQRLFDGLARGSRAVMPFAATFWSPGFGMVRDRFGTPWMVNVPMPA